jgi:glycosyltransferase involved in cell wall biosynthesis
MGIDWKQKGQMKTTLVMFSLNEIDGIQAIWPRLDKSCVDEIIVVDGGSTDGTIEFCHAHGIRCHVQVRKGMDFCLEESVLAATGDIIIMFTPDGNSLPEKVGEVVKIMKDSECDYCIASRYLPPARSEDDDFFTGIGNKLFTSMVNILYGCRVTDSLVGFFAFKKSLYLEMQMAPGDSWGLTLMLRCIKAGKWVREISASEPKRIGGVRKMRILRNGWWVLKTIIKEWLR